jgi:CubicO group peptidase (beta-lactamase class C family)
MSHLVLGHVLEKVSGESFDRCVERHVFEPLGMTSSFTSLIAPRTSAEDSSV